jgi:hypothetical protein
MFITKTCSQVMCTETISSYTENHMKHVKTLCIDNMEGLITLHHLVCTVKSGL